MRSVLLVASGLILNIWAGEQEPRILSFTLDEKPSAVRAVLGKEGGLVHQSAWDVLQFSGPGSDTAHANCGGEFEWEFFYDRNGQLISVTWNPEKQIPTAELFREGSYEIFTHTQSGATATIFLRRLSGERVLICNVSTASDTTLQQVMLMRSDSVKRFIPWLASRM